MYMQKVGPISRAMLGGSLATQQSPGQLLNIPCGGVMCALNLVVVEDDLLLCAHVFGVILSMIV